MSEVDIDKFLANAHHCIVNSYAENLPNWISKSKSESQVF